MRVVLVGPAAGRLHLRALLSDGVDVVGEAPTLAAARSAAFDTDAWLIAPDNGVTEDDADAALAESLTPREVEVLDLLAQGLPNKSIAARLAISDQTVKFHVASICGKLGAANRTDAVRRAVRSGLISL
ncbi:MAG: response regulator transcription factor [Vicinamibacterales bacterium]